MWLIKQQRTKQSTGQKYFYTLVQPSCAYMNCPVLSCYQGFFEVVKECISNSRMKA